MQVSVILAVWNGVAYLKEAIDSVLGQTLPVDEVIVVDDGSTDGTPAVLAGYGDAIRVIRQQNQGQCAAVIAGIAISRGSLLAFHDHDDVWPSGRNELQVNALNADPGLDAVFGLSEQFVSPELDEATRRRYAPERSLLPGKAASCLTLRRSFYERVGGFDPASRSAYFFEWISRAGAAGMKSVMLDEVVSRRRLHPANFGRTHVQARDRQLLATLHQHISRGRSST